MSVVTNPASSLVEAMNREAQQQGMRNMIEQMMNRISALEKRVAELENSQGHLYSMTQQKRSNKP
jgi:hypothetical protein